MNCATELQIRIGVAHFLFATGFLVALAFMVGFLFTRGNPEKDKVTDTDRKRKRRNNLIYRICGITMVACILLAALILFVPYLHGASWLQPLHLIFFLESFAILAFGFAWFVKGETFILKDSPKGADMRQSR